MPAVVKNDYVYLDWAASAPLSEEAARAMAPYQVPGCAHMALGGNANSLHSVGRAAFAALEQARKHLARAVGAMRPDEIVFTSGATEADNMALLGIAQGAAQQRRQAGAGSFTPHIIISAIEHDAVLAPAKYLESQGFRVSRLKPNAQGHLETEALQAALDDSVVLVSIQAANSEVGSIQPLAELARIAHTSGAFFHTDAVQALGKIPFDVSELGVDAASFSAHKVGGPKGVGALYLKARTPFVTQQRGGGQEAGRRSGTQNVAGAVGFAAACQAACALQADEAPRLRTLRDKLYAALALQRGIHATVLVEPNSERSLPHIVHVLVDGLESETLILRFDLRGFGVSGGSACSSHSLEPSHVLHALGIDDNRAHGALRISMGRYTTEEEIDAFLAAVPGILDWS